MNRKFNRCEIVSRIVNRLLSYVFVVLERKNANCRVLPSNFGLIRKRQMVPIFSRKNSKKKKNHSFKDDVHCFIHNVMLHNISYVAISGFAGGGYEVYDSYTGNVTVLMGPPPGHYPATSHYPPMGHHPMLAAMSYQPMPYDWFNPSNVPANDQWMYNRHHHKKSTPTADAQQVRWFSLFSFSKRVEKIHLFGNNLSFVKL